jgi:uncharacterized membrane protein SpoIIM required for sporulation/ABC-type transport system involved in multi-copper enzyme maturation permease subunit
MKERLHFVWMISKRELRDQLRDWRILSPLLLLTIGFPFLMNFFAYEAVSLANKYGGNLIVDRLVPFSILIIGFFPITISLLGALESFVGEKERGTIEPLLSSPLADWQLYLGKLIVGMITPLISSFVAIAIYVILVSRQGIEMPPVSVFAQLGFLTVAHALLMVSAAIVFSIQSTSVKAANLMASFIIIPVAMLMQGESALLFWGNNQVLWLAVAAVTIMAGLIVRLGLAHFQREYLLGREIDILNLRWMGRTFWRYFKGEADSLFGWFALSLPATLRKLGKPMVLLTFLAVVSAAAGFFWANTTLAARYASHPDPQAITDLRNQLGQTVNLAGLNATINAPALFAHNVQASLVIAFFGLFSFSVLGIILYLLNMTVIGVVAALLSIVGLAPGPILAAGLLPHGIFEIPALMLSCAAVLNIGLALITPQAGRTIGEVLIEALADWTRVLLGLVIPLLAVAAVVETYVTPALLLSVMR